MHVTLQLKVPIENATKVQELLQALIAQHEEEKSAFDLKIKKTPNSEKLAREAIGLRTRAKLLTSGNLLRLAVLRGIESLKAERSSRVLAELDEVGVARGRPRGR